MMIEREVEGVVDALIEVLKTQRRAMVALDVEALVASNSRSTELLARLGKLADSVDGGLRAIGDKAFEVSVQAEANALLVRDTLDVLRGLMGANEGAGTYDARGTVQAEGRRNVTRSI